MRPWSFLAAAVLIAGFAGGSGNASRETLSDPAFLASLVGYEQATGERVDVDRLQVMARAPFTLPVGAIGIDARVDWATGELLVVPLTAQPEDEGETGCVVPPVDAPFALGYTTSPVAVGDADEGCPFQVHQGGVRHSRLACFMFDACALVIVGQGFQELYCQFGAATYTEVDWEHNSGTAIGGVCFTFVFNFLPPPPAWPDHFAYVHHALGEALAVGLNNYKP